jgi:serine/threonine protein kinase
MWRALHHPNVLPLLGVVVNEARFAMVSEWIANGSIDEFIKAHPDANRFELVGRLSKPRYPRLPLTTT